MWIKASFLTGETGEVHPLDETDTCGQKPNLLFVWCGWARIVLAGSIRFNRNQLWEWADPCTLVFTLIQFDPYDSSGLTVTRLIWLCQTSPNNRIVCVRLCVQIYMFACRVLSHAQSIRARVSTCLCEHVPVWARTHVSRAFFYFVCRLFIRMPTSIP